MRLRLVRPPDGLEPLRPAPAPIYVAPPRDRKPPEFKPDWYQTGTPVVHFFFDTTRTLCGRVMERDQKAGMYDARCQTCKKARRLFGRNWRKQ